MNNKELRAFRSVIEQVQDLRDAWRKSELAYAELAKTSYGRKNWDYLIKENIRLHDEVAGLKIDLENMNGIIEHYHDSITAHSEDWNDVGCEEVIEELNDRLQEAEVWAHHWRNKDAKVERDLHFTIMSSPYPPVEQ